MHVIAARNVNDAYTLGVNYLRQVGRTEDSRAGPVMVAPGPVTTVYARPTERVLMDSCRDANPLFHLFESLWLLAGRDDARWLDLFVKDFSVRFAESEDGHLHGSYGKRWRDHWLQRPRPYQVGGTLHQDDIPGALDQLDEVVRVLRADPTSRQAVIAMWDPAADLGVDDLRDRPCNTHVYLRVRLPSWGEAQVTWEALGAKDEERSAVYDRPILDLTVCCRSNDVIWGAYGANAVQFSVLQEYLAARIGVGVGRMYQVSHNFHAYLDALERVGTPTGDVNPYDRGFFHLGNTREYIRSKPMVDDPDWWDEDLRDFMAWTPEQSPQEYPRNPWLHETAEPLFVAAARWRAGDRVGALEIVQDAEVWPDMAPDWRAATAAWMGRRMIG
jgi:thymidylate synthase